jgi:hypothetical protein
MSTTVRLVRKEGGATLDSLAGGDYVRPGASYCRPLLCVFLPLRPPPRRPRKASLKCPACLFFVVPPQGYFEGRYLEGLFFLIVAELRYKARGKPKNGELGGFCVIWTLQL